MRVQHRDPPARGPVTEPDLPARGPAREPDLPVRDNDAEAQRRLPALYDSATDLAIALEDAARSPGAALTAAQIGAFNQLLDDARALVPKSVALREDADPIDAETRAAVAHRTLRTTIIPTLHNALPADEYEKRL